MGRTTQKIMTKERFQKLRGRDKYRKVEDEVDTKLEEASSGDRFAFQMQEGSKFAVEEAKHIADTEDLVEVMKKE